MKLINKTLLGFLVIIMIVATIQAAAAEIIDGDTVYIDDSKLYMSATPHTSYGQDVVIELQSKVYSGDVNLLFAYPSDTYKPNSLSYWNPNLNNSNGAWQSANFNTEKFERELWGEQWTLRLAPNLNVNSFQNYKVKVGFDYSSVPIDAETEKYYICIYPSSYNYDVISANQNEHLYCLDPWSGAPPTGGLAYFDFEEGSGSTAQELWDNNDGTITGATYSATVPPFNISEDGDSYSLEFDGVSDYVESNSTIVSTGDKTISLWINPASIILADIIGTGDGLSSGFNGFDIFLNANGALTANVGSGSGEFLRLDTSASLITADDWYHLLLIQDTDELYLYVNNSLEASDTSSSGTETVGDRTLYFGARGSDLDTFEFDGLMDEIKIFNYALNSTERDNLFNYGNVSGLAVAAEPVNISYFSITATSNYDASAINSFGAVLSGLPYTYGYEVSEYLFNWTTSDSSGNSNDGTLNGYTLNNGTITGATTGISGKYGEGISFDGNDYITVDDNAVLDITDVSLSVWIKPDDTTLGTIFAKDDRIGKTDLTFNLLVGSNLIQFGYMNSTGTTSDTLSCSATAGSYYHFGLSYNTTHYVGYVNGVECDTIPYIGEMKTTALDLLIGVNDASGLERYFIGDLDEIRIWEESLTESEIQAEMNSRYPIIKPIASYSFEAYNTTHVFDTNWNTQGTDNSTGAIKLQGTEYLNVGDIDISSTQGSWGTWSKTSDFGSNQVMMGQDTIDGSNGGISLMIRTNYDLRCYYGDASYFGNGYNYPTDGAWHHVMCVYEDNTGTIYLDGVNVSYQSGLNNLSDSTADLYIGQNSVDNIYAFNGSLSEVRIFNKSLTSQEVLNLYDGSLVEYQYSTTNGTINTRIDNASGYTYNITLINATNHWNDTNLNVDVSSPLTGTLDQYPLISATNKWNSSTIPYNSSRGEGFYAYIAPINYNDAYYASATYITKGYIPLNLSSTTLTLYGGYPPATYKTQTLYLQSLLANTNNTYEMYQSVITFNASELLTGNTLTSVNYSTNGTAGATIYPNAGTYNVTASKSGYYDKWETFSVTALDQKNIEVDGLFNAYLFVQGWLNITNTATPLTGWLSTQTYNTSNINIPITGTNFSWLNGTTTYNLGYEIDGISGYRKEESGTTTVNLGANNTLNITLIHDNLHLSFDEQVTGWVLHNISEGETEEIVFNNTDFLIVQSNLGLGNIYIRFNAIGYENHTQYYEYYNNYTYTIDETFAIINHNTTLKDDWVKIVDQEGQPITEATIRLLQNPIGTNNTAELISQRITDTNGKTYFLFNENTEITYVISKEGYNIEIQVLNALDLNSGTESDPRIIVLTTNNNGYDGIFYPVIQKSYTNSSKNIYASVYALVGNPTIIWNTDYEGINRTITTNTDYGRYDFTIISGTSFPTNNSDITVNMWIGSTKYTRIIEYEAPPTETDLFDITNLSAVPLAIALILFSFIIGLLFKGDAGFNTFAIGGALIGFITPIFFLIAAPFAIELLVKNLSKLWSDG